MTSNNISMLMKEFFGILTFYEFIKLYHAENEKEYSKKGMKTRGKALTEAINKSQERT